MILKIFSIKEIARFRLALILFLSLACVSCEDFWNTVLDIPAPIALSVSDGDYSNSLEVNWASPSLASDKWEGYSIKEYKITWTGPFSGSTTTEGTSYTIYVSSEDRAEIFQVSVSLTLKTPLGGTETAGSASDTGFAMDAKKLVWQDGEGVRHSFSGEDQWYTTMLQKGFKYTLDFDDSTQASLSVYAYKTLSPVIVSLPQGNEAAWLCNDFGNNGKFYIQVRPETPGAGFRATYNSRP